MIKKLTKKSVQEQLLQQEILAEGKNKPKYSGTMSSTRNGRWLKVIRTMFFTHNDMFYLQ